MKKIIALLLALMMCLGLAACGQPSGDNSQAPATDPGTDATEPADPDTDTSEPAGDGEKPSVGFVTFMTSGEFFQSLADTYVTTMEAEGWDAYYVDGQTNPSVQMEAAENYISMGVDVLVIWSVSPESMTTVIEQAMAQGIKVIAFVAQTEVYDAVMLSDDAVLAGNLAKLAAQWIDTTFADAEDHSVPVAVYTCRAANTGVIQGDVLLKIEEYSTKAKLVKEVECADESATTGQTTAENLYVTNPEIKVFLTAHNGLAQGINNYFTSMNSPVTDYSDMGIFCINGDTATAEAIQASKDGSSPLRGTVLTGSVQDTANELRDVIIGLYDGTIASGHVQNATTLFVNADTVDEYLETGKTSLTAEDFE